VKQRDLGECEENVREKQNSKSRRIKGFGENVGQLSLGVYISHLNVPLLYMISQKVVSPLNMSHLFIEDWIFGY
jgi:hypothetical protein